MTTQPFTTNQPNDLPTRLALLQQHGHDYLDPTAQVALAASDTHPNEMLQIADSIKNGISSAYDGLTRFFDDPVLQKEPSSSLALQRYVNSSIGPSPIAEPDLAHIQQQIQAAGFGKDLPTTGTWDASWNSAYNQAAHKHLTDTLNGNKPGSVTVGHALRGFLHFLTPVGAVDALVGFAKSLPGDLRQISADSIGAGGTMLRFAYETAVHPGDLGSNIQTARTEGRREALGINHLLGGNETRQQLIHDTTGMHAFARLVNDVGTALLVSGVGSTAGAALKGVRIATTEGLLTSTAQAARGPGMIARNIFGGVDKRALDRIAGDSADPSRRVLLSKSFQNIPVIGRSAPMLGKLADSDGLWYRGRAVLDKPYDYGAVRAAGHIVASTGLAGVEIGGVASLEGALGGENNPIQTNVANTHVLDGLDDAVRNHTGVSAFGHHFGLSINDLAFMLHAPATGAHALSNVFGDQIQGLNDGLTHKLGQVGAVAQWEQATGRRWSDLVEAAGGQDRANAYLYGKVVTAAASHSADLELRGSAHTLLSEDWLKAKKAAERIVYNDNDRLTNAIHDMFGGSGIDSDSHHFANYIKKELTQSGVVGKDAFRRDVATYLDAVQTLQKGVLPYAQHILTFAHTPDEKLDEWARILGVPEAVATAPKPLTTGSVGVARFEPLRDSSGKIMRDPEGNVLADPLKSTLTAQRGILDVQAFRREVERAQTPPELDALATKYRAYMLHNFGLDAGKARVWQSDPGKLVDVIENQVDHLASEVRLGPAAPQEMRDAINRMKAEHGYQPVVGSDIGHAFRPDLPQATDVLGDPISRARRVLAGLGGNIEHFSSTDSAVDTRLRVVRELTKAVDGVRMPPNTTVNTILSVLQSDKNVAKALPWSDNVTFSLFRKAHQSEIDRLVAEGRGFGVTPADAEAQLKNEIAHAMGLRGMRYSEFKKVLTQPGENLIPEHLRDGDLSPEGIAGWFSEEDIPKLWAAVQRGLNDRPAYMTGAASLLARMERLPFALGPKSPSERALFWMNLPTNLRQVRDKYRFTLSPFFSFRRIAKTNVKMAAEGIQPTANPVKNLIDSGEWETAHATLDRTIGLQNPAHKYLDEADQFLHGTDVVGLYNGRHYAAYVANEARKQGQTDEQIAATVRKVVGYGSRTAEGRTALEQSINTVFFPFSFEKTLVRNFGGYLLDHPTQAMVLSSALDAYRDFNNHHLDGNNPLAASWYEQHLPLLHEVLRLNAFQHGISPGEFGGINAPLLNAFLPQSWASSADSNRTLTRFVPAMTDLKRIMKESGQQGTIVRQSVVNGVTMANDKLTGRVRGPLDTRPSNKTPDAQRQEAFDLRNRLVEGFKPVLDYNGGTSEDSAKYHWPTDGPAAAKLPKEVRGQAINKMSIGLLVQHAYPVYNPAAGAGYAIAKQSKANAYISGLAGTPRYEPYKDFLDKARTAIGHLNSDDYPAAQAQAVTALFRERAVAFASQDPSFLRFYNASLRYAFGPLEKQA